MQALGRSRLTFGLDLLVPESARELIREHLEQLGFETLHEQKGFSHHIRALERVDFIYLDPRTADLVIGGAVPTSGMPVARPEHLAMMKFLAVKNEPTRGRADLPDVVFLLRLPGIDREAVREYCEKHGMLELFHELIR